MIPTSLDPAWVREKLIACDVPAHTHEGYLRYLMDGIRPGAFLCAVLENDLRGAVQRADPINARTLMQHLLFLTAFAPSPCWGSPERVAAWIESFQVTVPHE